MYSNLKNMPIAKLILTVTPKLVSKWLNGYEKLKSLIPNASIIHKIY